MPVSATAPAASTTTTSASETVLSRCATTSCVAFRDAPCRNLDWRRRSVTLSSWLVASSSARHRARLRMARATLTRCLSPPDGHSTAAPPPPPRPPRRGPRPPRLRRVRWARTRQRARHRRCGGGFPCRCSRRPTASPHATRPGGCACRFWGRRGPGAPAAAAAFVWRGLRVARRRRRCAPGCYVALGGARLSQGNSARIRGSRTLLRSLNYGPGKGKGSRSVSGDSRTPDVGQRPRARPADLESGDSRGPPRPRAAHGGGREGPPASKNDGLPCSRAIWGLCTPKYTAPQGGGRAPASSNRLS